MKITESKLTEEIIEDHGFEFEEFPNPEWFDDNNNVIMLDLDDGNFYILNEMNTNQWTKIITIQDLLDYCN